jgi:hypothetical protein
MIWCVVRAGDEIAAGTISFTRFWERGEHSIGLGVDAASETGAFRLYERAGMSARLGFAIYEKQVDDRV